MRRECAYFRVLIRQEIYENRHCGGVAQEVKEITRAWANRRTLQSVLHPVLNLFNGGFFWFKQGWSKL
jgi:hypothetical protein